MAAEPDLVFPPFRLDLRTEQVWRGPHLVPLRPKTFAVLVYLVHHPQCLVTEAELLQAVWAGAQMSAGLLRGYMSELRAALGDEATAPRFIETVARRGWRFIAPVTTALPPSPISAPSASPAAVAASAPPVAEADKLVMVRCGAVPDAPDPCGAPASRGHLCYGNGLLAPPDRGGAGAGLTDHVEGGSIRHHLPLQLTSFIGCERETAAVKRLLATTRLFTLTGPGAAARRASPCMWPPT